jgi:hypothetical protein
MRALHPWCGVGGLFVVASCYSAPYMSYFEVLEGVNWALVSCWALHVLTGAGLGGWWWWAGQAGLVSEELFGSAVTSAKSSGLSSDRYCISRERQSTGLHWLLMRVAC